MYVEFQFDSPPDGLEATHLARLVLDLQHLVVVATALARPAIRASDPALNARIRSYKLMVEATHEQLLDTTAHVTLISQHSPLTIGLYLREVGGVLKAKTRNVLKLIFDRILFADLEREHLRIRNETEREDLRQKQIETLAKTFDLVEKIGDAALRERFVEGLDSAIRPFQEEHPPLRRAEVTERPHGMLE